MQLSELSAGKPALWKSTIYGDVAVHVKSVHHGIALVTVDGGEAARQVIDHPELADGWFVIPERLHRWPGKLPRKTVVKNTIRDVPGVGKVAVITDDRPKVVRRSRRPVEPVSTVGSLGLLEEF